MTGCPANLPLTHAPGQQHDTPFQAVVVEAEHCRQPQAFYAQLRQQGLTAIHFIPQLAAGDAALWGEFLCAVFHRRRPTAPAMAARGYACAAAANRKTRCARVIGSSTISAGPICE